MQQKQQLFSNAHTVFKIISHKGFYAILRTILHSRKSSYYFYFHFSGGNTEAQKGQNHTAQGQDSLHRSYSCRSAGTSSNRTLWGVTSCKKKSYMEKALNVSMAFICMAFSNARHWNSNYKKIWQLEQMIQISPPLSIVQQRDFACCCQKKMNVFIPHYSFNEWTKVEQKRCYLDHIEITQEDVFL